MKFSRVLALLLLASAPAAAQPGANAPPAPPPPAPPQVQVLTLDRAIEIALQQQPSIKQTKASIEAANARVQSAHVAQRPTVTVGGQLAESSQRGGVIPGSMGSPTGGGFFTSSLSTGVSASASWRIFDFGQTSANIRAAEANADATAATIGTTALDIRSSVAIAFLEAVARQRLIAVAQSTVTSEEGHLDQAKKFVAAQAKDPIEVAQAQSRAANARSSLAQAQSEAAVALANLRSAIGWLDPTVSFTVSGAWPTPPAEQPAELAMLVDAARKHRPEIVQLDKQLIAAQASVTAASAERRPVLSAAASAQWGPGENDWSPDPSWTAGLTLSVPIYDGGRASADIRSAHAGVLSVEANRDALLVSLTSELESARQQIIANRANVQASTEAVTAAQAQLKLADARYAQGLGSQIELADAQTAVTTAQGNLISAEWQLANAWALMARALGNQ